MEEFVILVNEADESIGTMEKLEAHKKGLLHRAFSVLIFNDEKKLLIQKRASHKYHSGGLWSNTCCSHPRPQEQMISAAKRRLNEEMGFECTLRFHSKFIYKTPLDNNLTEHELDYVFCGSYGGDIKINLDEVEDYKFISIEELLKDIEVKPNAYTVWFKIILNKLYNSDNRF